MPAWAASSEDDRRQRADAIVQALVSGRVGLTGLDELVQSAALATWAPVALISMITDRQVTGSAAASDTTSVLPARGNTRPFEDSVCVLALSADGPIRICDARHDDRVARIPATVDGILGSYLGFPLRAGGDDTVGVLCVYDAAPRSWSESDEHDLGELAQRVSAELARIASEYVHAVIPAATAPDPR